MNMKSGAHDRREKYFETIVMFHQRHLSKRHFPSHYAIAHLKETSEMNCFFPSFRMSKVFFTYTKKRAWAKWEVVVIYNIFILEDLTSEDINDLQDHFRSFGSDLLILVEDYNETALRLLEKLQTKDVNYSQQKLLAYVDNIHCKSVGDTKSVSIRNFVLNYDEMRYVRFYNKVLGYLGTRIDRQFMNNVILRPSFNPEGYFIAEANGEMVGFLAIEKNPWGDPSDTFGYIYQIGIDQQYRGRGVADVLLNEAKGFAGKYNIDRIGVGVSQHNRPAIRFFEKRQFSHAYEIKGFLITS